MERSYRILGACSCWGAQIRACEKGPADLLEGNGLEHLHHLAGIEMLHPTKRAFEQSISLEECLPIIEEFNHRLAYRIMQVLEAGEFPIVIGGDHVNAVGAWGGVRRYLLKKSPLPFGLIWIDAHMDAHTPETSPSGAWHGMPIAALLGYGNRHLSQLLQKEPILQPENLVLIGIRSFEEGEAMLLDRLKVKVYFIDEVKRRGLKAVLKEAIPNTPHFGVSMDLDVIDPKEAPGVGSPESNGLSAKEVLEALPLLAKDRRLSAFELVEFNPERDVNHQTRNLVYEILRKIT